jgi:hypothetical protein
VSAGFLKEPCVSPMIKVSKSSTLEPSKLNICALTSVPPWRGLATTHAPTKPFPVDSPSLSPVTAISHFWGDVFVLILNSPPDFDPSG